MTAKTGWVLWGIAVALYAVSLVLRLSGGEPLRWVHGVGAVILAAVALSLRRKPS